MTAAMPVRVSPFLNPEGIKVYEQARPFLYGASLEDITVLDERDGAGASKFNHYVSFKIPSRPSERIHFGLAGEHLILDYLTSVPSDDVYLMEKLSDALRFELYHLKLVVGKQRIRLSAKDGIAPEDFSPRARNFRCLYDVVGRLNKDV